jgi:glycosyltransferase involved in cell wall biosynthesis
VVSQRATTDALRVLFVMGANGTGGTELQARALIESLRAREVSISIVLLDGANGLDGLPSETVVIARERPDWFRILFTYGKAIRLIRRLLRSGEFDAIHAVHARGYTIASLAAVGIANVRRVAWRRNLGIHLAGRKAFVGRCLERASLLATDVVLANSADVRDYWVTRHGLAGEQVMVVPNLLQDWRFDVARAPVTDPQRIVAVGGLRPVKGHELLLRAVSGLGRQDTEVVILGEGERRAALAALAEDLKVSLVLPGVQTDPRPWLATATLYVHPSLSEGSSNAVMEAMAAGLPIVASDVGGTRELLDEAGVIVPPADADRLRDAIARLLDAPSERERLGGAARRRARERFSEEAVVGTTISVYKGDLPCADS